MNEPQSFILLDYGKRTAVAELVLIQMQEAALAASALISKVDSVDSNTVAVAAQVEIHAYIKNVEKAEKAALAPLNVMRTAIFGLRDKMLTDVKPEQMRLAKLVGDYQELENAKVRAAEVVRRLEEERLQRERYIELQRIRHEAEAAQNKLRAEQAAAAAKMREAKNAAERAEAEKLRLEIERQVSIAAAATAEQMADAQEQYDREIRAMPVTAEPVRAKGQVVTAQWEIVISDINALYRAHPLCVELQPRLTEIKTLLDMGITPKGVTAKKVTVARVQVERSRNLLEV